MVVALLVSNSGDSISDEQFLNIEPKIVTELVSNIGTLSRLVQSWHSINILVTPVELAPRTSIMSA